MQHASGAMRNSLWDGLKIVFNRYVDPRTGEIETSVIEEIVREVLGEKSKMEIDYVMKNMFRLDVDENGGVSFFQFGNFLFKRHCGEISLQKMHRSGKVQFGGEKKIQLQEFIQLLNNAYAFLGVRCQEGLARQIFQQADKDSDGKITYVEYFQFIDKFICFSSTQYADYEKGNNIDDLPTESQPQPEPQGRLWNSRIRIFFWMQLKRLYDAYVKGRALKVNDEELRGLILSILGDIPEIELTFLLNELYRLDYTTIEFIPFAIAFLYLIGELGLSRFQKNHPSSKRTLTRDQFFLLFINTYKFLSANKIKPQLLYLLFAKIDTNSDGLISFEQYLEWIKKFIAVDVNCGEQYYMVEDDDSIGNYDIFELIIPTKKEIEKDKSQYQIKVVTKFKFTSYELAERVRQRVLELLIPYDRNKDRFLEKSEIQKALIALLKQNDLELLYVTRNRFRYDKDQDNKVSYSQFTDFCVAKHFGQMAIQRLHLQRKYSRGHDKMMSYSEFESTLRQVLNFINLQANPSEIKPLFNVLDDRQTGWISYKYYFMFLRHYFGSLSPIFREQTQQQLYLQSLADLTALERFIRLLLDQLRDLFLEHDYNKNLLFEMNEIEAILEYVFEFDESERNFILFTFFRMETRREHSLTFDELVAILLQVYFVEILIKRRYKNRNAVEWKTRKISLEEFILLMTNGCFFIKLLPQRADLVIIFNIIDTNRDGFITFQEYFNFIKKYLGNGYELPDVQQEKIKTTKSLKDGNQRHSGIPVDVSSEEWDFILMIWSELKEYFDRFDEGNKGYLTESDLKNFIIQVLNETTQRELDYIFWNMFRIDPNGDKAIQFYEFAPFILNHSGEIALQKFHRQQTKGKSSLTEEELYIVFSNAFSFLKSLPKAKTAVSFIYRRIGKGTEAKYSAYLGWINRALALKFR